MTNKNKLGILTIVLTIVSAIYIGYKLVNYYSFANEQVTQQTQNSHHRDTLTVIFIGDSWATYHSQYDQHLKACIETKINKPTKVISKGTVGAKTKTIYAKMHADSPSGTKELINLSPHYAIVSAGINDAVAKMGTENYSHHYKLIIKELLSAGIKPIIIDMPQVDYRAIYQRESSIARTRHRISSWITKAPLWTFKEYRMALRSLINRGELKTKVIYVPSTDWNPNGYADSRILYREDHVHLNEKGYSLLDSCITSHIYNDFNNTLSFQ